MTQLVLVMAPNSYNNIDSLLVEWWHVWCFISDQAIADYLNHLLRRSPGSAGALTAEAVTQRWRRLWLEKGKTFRENGLVLRHIQEAEKKRLTVPEDLKAFEAKVRAYCEWRERQKSV